MHIFQSFTGMLGFLFEFKSCQMAPPATVATLRTTEIVVAFVTQILLTHKAPQLIDTLGAIFVFTAALVLIFEKQIYDRLLKLLCFCTTSTSAHERLNEETDQTIDTENNISVE